MEQEALGHNFNERTKDIVGMQTAKTEDMSDQSRYAKKENLTVEQKVAKELDYVTQAMDLDEFGRKHWFYKLKREYEA